MIERTLQPLVVRLEDAAEETPIIKGLRRMVRSGVYQKHRAFSLVPRRRVQFYRSNLKSEIEVLTGTDRSALASEVF